MNLTKLESGAYIIDIEKIEDERGFFARMWDKNIFKELGLDSDLIKGNISYNKKKGTLRGFHFQKEPDREGKIVRCTKGRVFEVLLDIRKESPTYLKWTSVELSEENHRSVFVPKGFALAFQTLEDNSEIYYLMTEKYVPNSSDGIRWNDPKLEIDWPMKPTVISEKDKSWGFL